MRRRPSNARLIPSCIQRLLLLLDREELSVAELAAITQLAQPRVSTHLARLKEAGLVSDRRDGVFVYYRIAQCATDKALDDLWRLLRRNTRDPLLQQDLEHPIERVGKQLRSHFSWLNQEKRDSPVPHQKQPEAPQTEKAHS